MTVRYMLDTNVYTYIDDEGINLEPIKTLGEFFYTNVQVSELSDIPDTIKRKRRLAILHEICSIKVAADIDAWMDSLRWDDDNYWREEPNIVANRLAKGSYVRKKRHDALIGSAAKEHQCVLVTGESKFAAKARGEGIKTMTAPELFASFVTG